MLHATSITQLFPKTQPNGNTIYMVEHYEVGKQSRLANYGLEEVEEIVVLLDPQLIAAIRFKDYGTIWITSHIIEVRYERPEYRDLRRERINAKKPKDSSGK